MPSRVVDLSQTKARLSQTEIQEGGRKDVKDVSPASLWHLSQIGGALPWVEKVPDKGKEMTGEGR